MRGGKEILQRDEDDAGRYHWFHDPIGKPYHVENCKREGDCVSERKCSDQLEQVPHGGDCEHKPGHEKQMIVTAKDMCDAMTQKRNCHGGLIEATSGFVVSSHCPQAKRKWLPRSKE